MVVTGRQIDFRRGSTGNKASYGVGMRNARLGGCCSDQKQLEPRSGRMIPTQKNDAGKKLEKIT